VRAGADAARKAGVQNRESWCWAGHCVRLLHPLAPAARVLKRMRKIVDAAHRTASNSALRTHDERASVQYVVYPKESSRSDLYELSAAARARKPS
jgi:hypothetical protein